jgi:hypothetical protein
MRLILADASVGAVAADDIGAMQAVDVPRSGT